MIRSFCIAMVLMGGLLSGQTSVPTPAPQPNAPSYSPVALDLFETFTRATFQEALGVQAPVFDATKPVRQWFDTSATPGPYQTVQANTSANPPAQMIPLAVPAGVSLPNLAGVYQYPPYQNLPLNTSAVFTWGVGLAPTPVPVADMCSLLDAQAVAASFGLGALLGQDPSFNNVSWGTETRRAYTVTPSSGATQDACPLRAQMTLQEFTPSGTYVSGGVGSPGTWASPATDPVWVPTSDPGLTASGAPVPVPMRSLLPNEQFALGPLNTVVVERTDMAQGGGGSALSSAQQLYEYQVLDALNQKYGLGVPPPAQ